MPRYLVRVRIIENWSCEVDAEDAQAARDIGFKECEDDTPPNGYLLASAEELVLVPTKEDNE